VKHFASSRFWSLYEELPGPVRALADRCYELLKLDSTHPSLHFKSIGSLWSVRIGSHYRALGHEVPGGIHWFWIGSHSDYDKLIRRTRH
jgi:hypothetical protein